MSVSVEYERSSGQLALDVDVSTTLNRETHESVLQIPRKKLSSSSSGVSSWVAAVAESAPAVYEVRVDQLTVDWACHIRKAGTQPKTTR